MPEQDKELEEKRSMTLEKLCLMDNPLFSLEFDGRKRCISILLKAILEKSDLTVKSVQTQKEMENVVAHSVTLDIRAVDEERNLYDIEIQREKEKDTRKRARFYSAAMDVHALRKGRKYGRLPLSYVIFLTEGDHLGLGDSIYRIDRRINGSWRSFEDGTYIIYVDVLHADRETELGKLMADMLCTDWRKIHNKEFADVVRYYKDTKAGRKKVMGSKAFKELEDYCVKKGRNEGRIEERYEIARSMLAEGDSATKVARVTKLPPSKVESIKV